MREALLDVEQGADVVMVKPALGYLDVVRRVRDAVTVPVAAYNVSGEYAMVEAAAANGWIDREPAILETLGSIHRAGADVILTYWAAEAAAPRSSVHAEPVGRGIRTRLATRPQSGASATGVAATSGSADRRRDCVASGRPDCGRHADSASRR